MQNHRVSCNCKAQAGPADLPGMGLVHPEKAFENVVLVLLWNPDSRVRHFNIEELVIRIQRRMHPAAFIVILDGIFHQVGYRQRHLHLVDLCSHGAEAFQNNLHIFLFRNGLEPFEGQLQKLVDINLRNVQIRRGLAHLHQGQKVVDDVVFPVNLFGDVFHKFLIQLYRHLFLEQKGIRQYLHGRQRRLQLMGYVGYKFFPGSIHHFQPAQQFVEGFGNLPRLPERIHMQLFILKPLRNILDVICNFPQGLYDAVGDQHGKRQHQHYDDP